MGHRSAFRKVLPGLFRAYRRCDDQPREFQEKIIALIMDDATSDLKDSFAILALAQEWQERQAELTAKLQSIDPNRKSPDLWMLVDLIEEMCPRLPGMLNLLKDIVMPRGFEKIVENQFQDVLHRLPEPNS